MRFYEIIKESYEEWVEAYQDGRPVVRVSTPNGLRPPRYLYRVMSAEEWQAAERSGYFRPRPGERIHAASHPDLAYHSGHDTVTVRFDYRDEDGWQAKWGKELYATTMQPIPFQCATLLGRSLNEAQMPHYQFVTTCENTSLNGPYGEAIHDMKRAHQGIIDFDDIMRLIGPQELRNAGLDPDTLADDWAVSWEQSTWRGIPCIYIVQSGIEHIFTPNGQTPGPWVDEDDDAVS